MHQRLQRHRQRRGRVTGHQGHFQFGPQPLADPGARITVDIGQFDVARQHVDVRICSQGIDSGVAIVCFEHAVTGVLQFSTTSSRSSASSSIKRMRVPMCRWKAFKLL
jgi:hypothetical protein